MTVQTPIGQMDKAMAKTSQTGPDCAAAAPRPATWRRFLPLGVGISSGPIAFGAAGSGSAAFSAHGPAIEVTRVLAASARKLKGAILLDAAAQGFAKSAVETRPSRKIELPGQDERVQTFELLGLASGADEEFLGANAEVPIRV